ncbi:MAG: hypothetical protein ACLTCI_01975 [[Clostridium] nexile]
MMDFVLGSEHTNMMWQNELKGGKGDILEEFQQPVPNNIDMGLYLSPWDIRRKLWL